MSTQLTRTYERSIAIQLLKTKGNLEVFFWIKRNDAIKKDIYYINEPTKGALVMNLTMQKMVSEVQLETHGNWELN